MAKTKTKSRAKTATKTKAQSRTRLPKVAATKPRRRATARSMAAAQREISVSEFFTKNRHLLGFDSPTKALLTTIKEAVDNSLDACEEAGIRPTLKISIEATGENRYRVAVTDNGPGILKNQIPRIFGKLLYGSKFHRLRQSRGQQGIGISAAGMYGQLTTGKPIVIESRTSKRRPAHRYELVIDTKKNQPVVQKDSTVPWEDAHGTRVEIELEGVYRGGKHGVENYLRQTTLANPHVEIRFWPPGEDEETSEPIVFKRASMELPVEAREIKPHPYGVELGLLLRMLKDTQATTLKQFFQTEFSRVGPTTARRLAEAAGLRSRSSPRRVSPERVELLLAAIAEARIPAPPTDCLSPIGEERILSSLKEQVEAEYYDAITRSPAVYRGNPFQVEVGLAHGGELGAEDLAAVFRYANRVPLLYQAGACALTKSVLGTNWKSYGLLQARGAPPTGPLLLMVHIASVWVPFTSESKEAVASYDEIIKEVKLALQHVGRRLGVHLKRAARARDAERKRQYIEKYIPHVGIALREILDLSERQEKKVVTTLTDTLRKSRKM
ncbi:MAG: DNA topoisomerase VI subunit B [bacterium]|nr:DNA topoisomerase VI subunit B [bacterium]